MGHFPSTAADPSCSFAQPLFPAEEERKSLISAHILPHPNPPHTQQPAFSAGGGRLDIPPPSSPAVEAGGADIPSAFVFAGWQVVWVLGRETQLTSSSTPRALAQGRGTQFS